MITARTYVHTLLGGCDAVLGFRADVDRHEDQQRRGDDSVHHARVVPRVVDEATDRHAATVVSAVARHVSPEAYAARHLAQFTADGDLRGQRDQGHRPRHQNGGRRDLRQVV